ncbi:MAG: RNA chaperone Hfq [Butyricicoccus sp.]
MEGILVRNDINLQDAFLNVVRQQGQMITVILMNGYQMRGVIRGFDSFIVMLESDGRQQMVYKHAISTMIPTQRVEFYTRREERMAGE